MMTTMIDDLALPLPFAELVFDPAWIGGVGAYLERLPWLLACYSKGFFLCVADVRRIENDSQYD